MTRADETVSGSGVVVRYEPSRGFGFIKPDEDGPDIFVHASVIPDKLRARFMAGHRVSYVMFDSSRGPKARSVTSLDNGGDPVRVPETDALIDPGPHDMLTPAELTWEIYNELKDGGQAIPVTRIVSVFVSVAKRHGWVFDD